MGEHIGGPGIRVGTLVVGLLLAFLPDGQAARAQQPPASTPSASVPAATDPSSQENLTVLGRRKRFEAAPVPGAELPPPPDKPAPHLGRYKISGDQEQHDGYDTQTGAYIAPFGTAYTGASAVSNGLASQHEH